MQRILRAHLGLTMVLVLAGCSLPSGAALQSEVLAEQDAENPTFQVVQVTRNATPELAKWPITGWKGNYHWLSAGRGPDSSLIQSGDNLDIVIWDSQENSLLASVESKSTAVPTMTVSASGNIFMPYVGEVPVRGLTAGAARANLQKRLEDIAPTAQVQVSIKQGDNNSVDMVGGVSAPGSFPLKTRNTRILSVLAQAGGISPSLRHPLVVLQRGGNSYETRAEALLSEPARNTLVRGGDQIVVIEDDRSFNVLGAASSQKIINFEKEQMSAMEAISAMGGLSSTRANPKGLLVLREYGPNDVKFGPDSPDMQQVIFSLDLTSADGLFAARQFNINPNDTVLATESPITRVQTILGLFGTVVGVGATANNLTQ